MVAIKSFLLTIYGVFLSISLVPQYTEGFTGQPVSFFPSKANSRVERSVSTLIYRSLFKYDIYGSVLPDLAEWWQNSEDGLVYTVKLKDNQFWSDGKKINADDLIYTSYKVSDLAGIATDKVDELTVRYTLPNKYAPFLSLMTSGVMYNQSEEKQSALAPISSGDWRVVRIEKKGPNVKQIVLRTTSVDYKVKKLIFKFYSNEAELETAAKLGEINAFMSDAHHEIQGFSDRKFSLQGVYYALYFNLNNEILKDADFRKNLQKTLDLDALTYLYGIPVSGPISRSTFTATDISFNKYENGFRTSLPDKSLVITIPDTKHHAELAAKIKDEWEDRLDINVEVNKVSQADIIDKVVQPRNFEVLLYGQEVGRDPDRYSYWHSTQKDFPGLNLSGFEQVRADRALEEGRKELDNNKRLVHYEEFQKVFAENVPAIFLYHPFVHYYVSDYIQGIGEKYTFTYSDRFLDLKGWERIKTI